MKPEIKKRIEQIRSGVVPEGYKKTKMGIVPVDWGVKRLEEIAKEITRINDGESYPILTISSLSGFLEQGERFSKVIAGESLVKYTLLEENEFAYNKGYSRTYPQGCIFRLEDYNKALVPNVYISFIIIEGSSNYYKYYFIAGLLNHQLGRTINTGVRSDGLLNLYDEDFFVCQLAYPPLNEQEKIAEILSTWDQAITLKEQLIAEKKQQKKWLMQNLFTGKKRLPGFIDDWNEDVFGHIVIQVNNKVDPVQLKPDIICIELEHIEQETGRLLGFTQAMFQKSMKNSFNKGDVLFGKLRPYLKKYYLAEYTGVCSTEIWILRGIAKLVNNQYLFYYVQTTDFIKSCNTSTGSKMPRADWDLVSNIMLMVPSLPEQIAIAQILSTADREIDLHEKQLEELKKQKKALVQLLLTGIVRVNVQEVS